MPSYEVFELLVGARTADGYPAATTQSPAGDGSGFCSLDTQDHRLQASLEALEQRQLDAGRLTELGDLLFKGLFAGDIAGLFRSSLNVARAREKRLVVRLRIEPPELSALPWEYLHDAREDVFLAISPATALVRYVPMHGPVRPLSISPPLRVLVLIANPRDGEPLNVEQEKAIVLEALEELVTQGRVELEFLERARVADISQALRRFRPHVFHFVGHGLFSRGGALVVLEDETGNARPVDERTFREFFTGLRETRLAVLNACQTATISSSQPLVGLAPRILQRQIPAVVAMQYPLLDEAALIFSREFYRSLALAYPVDVAISEARKGIYLEMGAQAPDWGIPVLFMRSPDGMIWQMETTEDETTIERAGVQRDWIEGSGDAAAPDAAAPGGRIRMGGGVTITGEGQQIVVGGDLVGGDKTEIVDSQIYIAGGDLFQGQLMDRQDLIAELERLSETLQQVAELGEIDEEEAILAGAQVEAAISNAKKPQPDPARITQRLDQAQEILVRATAGAGAAAGLATALARAAEMVRQFFV